MKKAVKTKTSDKRITEFLGPEKLVLQLVELLGIPAWRLGGARAKMIISPKHNVSPEKMAEAKALWQKINDHK